MKKSRTKAAYMISSVAEQYGIHPQTLRMYEREGLLEPSRSEGNTRLYTDEDLARLEVILKLTRDMGVNLAGVEIILNMRARMEAMQRQMGEFITSLNRELAIRVAPQAPREQNSQRTGDRYPDEETRNQSQTEAFDLAAMPTRAPSDPSSDRRPYRR
jgi:MerR family transcriptional regulator, heat shock protein HspR